MSISESENSVRLSRLQQAQDIYGAWQTTDRNEKLDMAKKALEVSDFCADA